MESIENICRSLLGGAIITFILLITGEPARADARINWNSDGAVFRSLTKSAQAEIQFGEQVLAITAGGNRRKFKMDLALLRSGDFYISDNGEWLVWVLKSFAPTEVGPETAVIIVFHKDIEVRRLAFKDLGGLKTGRSVSHTQWNENVSVDFSAAQIRIVEMNPGKRLIGIDFKTGTVSSLVKAKVSAISGTQPEGPNQDYAKAMQDYTNGLQEISNWYREENQKLAEKLDKMSDSDVNAATQKLMADYNRRLIKLQAKMPTIPTPVKAEQTSSSNTIPPHPPLIHCFVMKKSDRAYIFQYMTMSELGILEQKFAPDLGYQTIVFWPNEFTAPKWIAIAVEYKSSAKDGGGTVKLVAESGNGLEGPGLSVWRTIDKHELVVQRHVVTGKVKVGNQWVVVPDMSLGPGDVGPLSGNIQAAADRVGLKLAAGTPGASADPIIQLPLTCPLKPPVKFSIPSIFSVTEVRSDGDDECVFLLWPKSVPRTTQLEVVPSISLKRETGNVAFIRPGVAYTNAHGYKIQSYRDWMETLKTEDSKVMTKVKYTVRLNHFDSDESREETLKVLIDTFGK